MSIFFMMFGHLSSSRKKSTLASFVLLELSNFPVTLKNRRN